jgi:hypothetical protein
LHRKTIKWRGNNNVKSARQLKYSLYFFPPHMDVIWGDDSSELVKMTVKLFWLVALIFSTDSAIKEEKNQSKG